MKANKKRTITMVVALLMAAGSLKAQIFLMDEDYENSLRTPSSSSPLTPYQGGDIDQTLHVPVGSGLFLLAGLGGLYALGKRKKK